jgi:FkbM family methyltransferase
LENGMNEMKRPDWKLKLARLVARNMYRMQGTGLPRISEAIRRRVARGAAMQPEKGSVWIDDFCGDLRFCCDLSEHMGSQIFFRGSYSGGQLVVLRRLLSPDAVFVDAGANQGEFTVCAAGRLPDGHVFAFEPVPAVRERLERNVAGNGFGNVTICPVGLSDENQDDVPIYGADSAFSDGTQHMGLPTLFDVSGRSSPLAQITLRRLDEELPEGQRVDVMKVDVEGAELAVLKGAAQTIQREKPTIIFEANAETCEAAGYSVEALFEWLERHGYDQKVIGPAGELTPLGEQVRFCNVLAVHPAGRSVKAGDGGA